MFNRVCCVCLFNSVCCVCLFNSVCCVCSTVCVVSVQQCVLCMYVQQCVLCLFNSVCCVCSTVCVVYVCSTMCVVSVQQCVLCLSVQVFVGCVLLSVHECLCKYFPSHIEGSRPKWCISSMTYSGDTPFWSEILYIFIANGVFYPADSLRSLSKEKLQDVLPHYPTIPLQGETARCVTTLPYNPSPRRNCKMCYHTTLQSLFKEKLQDVLPHYPTIPLQGETARCVSTLPYNPSPRRNSKVCYHTTLHSLSKEKLQGVLPQHDISGVTAEERRNKRQRTKDKGHTVTVHTALGRKRLGQCVLHPVSRNPTQK